VRQCHTSSDDTLSVLKRRLAELRSANHLLTDSASIVAQALSDPLTRILSVGGLLITLPTITTNPVALDMASQLLAGARKMQTLVDDYLAFFKAGRGELELQPVSLELLIELVRHELEPLAAGRKVRWHVGALPEVQGEPAMLHQVFLNLLGNALKFTRTRAEAVIEIGVQQHPKHMLVYIRDNGIGFDAEAAANLFHKFQRLHPDFEGAGVGLVVVNHILRRHGGHVWAEGVPGKGATFYIALPIAK
jgi:signal transduction histidine kinase